MSMLIEGLSLASKRFTSLLFHRLKKTERIALSCMAAKCSIARRGERGIHRGSNDC